MYVVKAADGLRSARPQWAASFGFEAEASCDYAVPDATPGTLVVGEDADERAVHDEPGRLEGVAGGAGRRDALGLGANQRLCAPKVRLPYPAGHWHRGITLQEVDVPHRTVVELASVVRHVLQDVERRFVVEDGRVLTLALRIVGARLAVDEGDQVFPRAPRVDERRGGVDVIGPAVRRRHVVERGGKSHVLDRRGNGVRGVERHVVDALVLVAAVGDVVAHRVVDGIDGLDLVRPVRLVRAVGGGSVADLLGVQDDPARQLDQWTVSGVANRAGRGLCGRESGRPGNQDVVRGEIDSRRHVDRLWVVRRRPLDAGGTRGVGA